MLRHINNIEDLPELFEKLKYETNKYWASYTAMLFDIKDERHHDDFWKFLLKHLRISDTIFMYGRKKYIVILEETTQRWAILLNDKLRDKINEKWFNYDYFCSSIQWDSIDDIEKLKKRLKKRLKKAKECNTKDCVYSLSHMG